MIEPRCSRCQRRLPVSHKPGEKDPPGCCWADHKLGESHEEIECRDLTIERLERAIELASLVPAERKQSKFIESDAKFFENVEAIVEADSFARHTLWLIYYHKPLYGVQLDTWEQKGGYMIQLGYLDRRPINIDISFDIINGKKVMFWSDCSQVVDHNMIDSWFSHFTPPGCGTANAMNFTNALGRFKPLTRIDVAEFQR